MAARRKAHQSLQAGTLKGATRGIVTGPEPAVIDEELCRKCIAAIRTKPGQSGEAQETKKEATAFKEVRYPCFFGCYVSR